jgi:hypothetical protein
MSIYGGQTVPILGIAAGCDCIASMCCNNTSVCNLTSPCYNLTLCQNPDLMHHLANNVTGCVALAVAHPTPWNIAAVLPIMVGGFALSNMGIRGMRLWGMELFDWIMRR